MENIKLKYVRTDKNVIIIFPDYMVHSDFRSFNPVSAGFCYYHNRIIRCYGESISLGLKSDPLDGRFATEQHVKHNGIYSTFQLQNLEDNDKSD